MTVVVVKAPAPWPMNRGAISVFLAGSIEMGTAVDWQTHLTMRLTEGLPAEVDLTILNPRRDDWDASWRQVMDDTQFFEQVDWELRGLEVADVIAMYFAPGTKAPITLLEYGLYARVSGRLRDATHKLIVCCPDGFWRKGNVEMVAARYGVMLYEEFDRWAAAIVAAVVQGRGVQGQGAP